MEKVIKRGYVKWTDEFGVFHKEPLANHPELLAAASVEDQIAAEEARRLNEAAEFYEIERLTDVHEAEVKTLDALKAAPEEVLVAAQLATDEHGDPIPEKAEEVTSADMSLNTEVVEKKVVVPVEKSNDHNSHGDED